MVLLGLRTRPGRVAEWPRGGVRGVERPVGVEFPHAGPVIIGCVIENLVRHPRAEFQRVMARSPEESLVQAPAFPRESLRQVRRAARRERRADHLRVGRRLEAQRILIEIAEVQRIQLRRRQIPIPRAGEIVRVVLVLLGQHVVGWLREVVVQITQVQQMVGIDLIVDLPIGRRLVVGVAVDSVPGRGERVHRGQRDDLDGVLAKALDRTEKVRLVLEDRSAEGSAEARRIERRLGRRKRVARVERRVAAVVRTHPVPIVGSRSRQHVDDGGAGA